MLSLLATSACAGTAARDTVTGNVVAPKSVSMPKQVRWITGQLMNEPAPDGSACLLLVTSKDKYVLRSVDASLVPVVWHQDGSFDATRSGIARGDRMVAPYADERTSVRGGVVAKSDRVCRSHPTLGFAQVKRGRVRPAPSTAPSTAPSGAPSGVPSDATSAPADAEAMGRGNAMSAFDEVWKSGTLGIVEGNQGEGHCLLLVTSEGAYVLGSSTNDYRHGHQPVRWWRRPTTDRDPHPRPQHPRHGAHPRPVRRAARVGRTRDGLLLQQVPGLRHDGAALGRRSETTVSQPVTEALEVGARPRR